MVNQSKEDPVREPWGQEALDHNVFVVPLLNGFTFHICGVGCILWNWTCVHSIKVAPVVCGLHGLLEMHGKGGPVAAIFFEGWDSGREYWDRHDNVV